MKGVRAVLSSSSLLRMCCGAILQDLSAAAAEVRLCMTLLLTHCINSADVPSPEISQHRCLERGGNELHFKEVELLILRIVWRKMLQI